MENENRRGSKKERWTSREEERVWIGFYRRAGDPAIAADLMEQMEADSEVKARHLGLYLRCRQSLRREKMRRARARAAAHAVHALIRLAVLAPAARLLAIWNFVGAVCMTWVALSDEPAIRQMRKIRRTGASSKTSSAAPEERKATARQA